MNNKEKFILWREQGLITESAFCTLTAVSQEPNLMKEDVLKISVLISTHNRSDELITLLNSVCNQNYGNYEVIIVDDASTDDTTEKVKSYIESHNADIHYLKNETNQGVSNSKKIGYEAATGDIIIFADDDDYYIDHNYFRMLGEIYNNDTNCVMTVASTIDHKVKDDSYEIKTLNFDKKITTREYLLGFAHKYAKPSSMLTLSMRASAIQKIPYKELKCFNDMSLYLFGCLAEGQVYPILQSVAVYTVQKNSISSGTSARFIIDNLDAKCDVAKRALKQGYMKNTDEWIFKQCSSSLNFYFLGNTKAEDRKKVFSWIKENISSKYRMKVCLSAYKCMIKHLYRPLR